MLYVESQGSPFLPEPAEDEICVAIPAIPSPDDVKHLFATYGPEVAYRQILIAEAGLRTAVQGCIPADHPERKQLIRTMTAPFVPKLVAAWETFDELVDDCPEAAAPIVAEIEAAPWWALSPAERRREIRHWTALATCDRVVRPPAGTGARARARRSPAARARAAHQDDAGPGSPGDPDPEPPGDEPEPAVSTIVEVVG